MSHIGNTIVSILLSFPLLFSSYSFITSSLGAISIHNISFGVDNNAILNPASNAGSETNGLSLQSTDPDLYNSGLSRNYLVGTDSFSDSLDSSKNILADGPGNEFNHFKNMMSASESLLASVPPTNIDFRGLWVATVVNIDWPKKPTTSSSALKEETLAALNYTQEHRFNAVFLQVRPTADAFYPSKLAPYSKYLTGTQGLAPDEGFDPLQFWIDEAHKRGIELHAWLNPYRITKTSSLDPIASLQLLSPLSPARLHDNWVIKHSDGNLYYNPGLPEVRKYLLACVEEIIDNYSVDGIHFDDYFYPDGSATKDSAKNVKTPGISITAKGTYSSTFNDSAAFKLYGKKFQTLDDWRRDNVNTFVKEVSNIIRKKRPDIRFGISPFAIWRNLSNDSLGSDTAGSEAYSNHAADTRKWVKEGWIDYIIPQIYWNIGYKIADYEKIADWWISVVKDTPVDLYIGQAAYRMEADNPDSVWYGTSELEKQMAANLKKESIKGSVFFSYQSFVQSPALGAVLKSIWEKKDGLGVQIPSLTLTLINLSDEEAKKQKIQALSVARPSANVRTNSKGHYITGSSDPTKPLYYNGEPITARSENGFFGFFVPLLEGKNTVALSQQGTYVVRNIYRNKSAVVTGSTALKMAAADIPAASVYPQTPLYGQPGETYILSCTAPIGAKVSVKVNGITYNMKPNTTVKPGSGIYATTYKVSWVMPKQSGSPRVVDAGVPVYKMTYLGKTKIRSAPAKIGIILPGAPFYATMLNEPTETFTKMSTSGGTDYYMDKGSKEAVTGVVGNYARLASGLFVKTNTITLGKEKKPIVPTSDAASYFIGTRFDGFVFSLSEAVAVSSKFDGKKLYIRVPLVKVLQVPILPLDSLFESVVIETFGSGSTYIFTLKPNTRLDGFLQEKIVLQPGESFDLNQTAAIQNLNKSIDLGSEKSIQNTNETLAANSGMPSVTTVSSQMKLGYRFTLKRHIPSIPGERPLLGKTVLLDPGHGGSNYDPEGGDTGAIGPLGSLWSERNINLTNSLVIKNELEKLGATVYMTRTTDIAVSLEERLAMSKKMLPDLFLSIHADSMNDDVDISKLSGFSVFFREPLAESYGRAVLRSVVNGLGRKDRNLNQRNFYVTRGTWTPSILIEMGFVPNINEFEQLIDPVEQQKMAAAIGSGIVEFFAK